MVKTTEFDNVCEELPPCVGSLLKRVPLSIKETAMEIRLRSGQPVSLFDGRSNLFIGSDGRPVQASQCGRLSGDELTEALIRLCGYSVQSYSEELKRGYFTTPQGNRVGVCLAEGTGFASVRPISMNIRLAREIFGAANALLPVWRVGSGIILAGPPASGKTTILRDFARQLSEGKPNMPPLKVSVVDERYEISGLIGSQSAYQLGPCTDILPGYGKREGIQRALRTLSPQVILCDEIASPEEIDEIRYAFACGVRFLVTVHCGGEESLQRNMMLRLLRSTGAFSHIVLLGMPRTGSSIKAVIPCDAVAV